MMLRPDIHSPLLLLTTIVLFLTIGLADGLSQPVLIPGEESRIWIEGRSNVNQFGCNAERFEGQARQKNRERQPGEGDRLGENEVDLQLKIPVEYLDCGRRRMNRDLLEALKADRYDAITFSYIGAEILDDQDGEIQLEVTGSLTVAGVSRTITFLALGSLGEDDKMKITGAKTVRMTDFEVDPPTGMLGMIRADDELTVHFEITAIEEP